MVQLLYLSKSTHIDPFLEGYEQSVAILMKHVEWKNGTFTLIQRNFLLMLSWAITTHKSQGRT